MGGLWGVEYMSFFTGCNLGADDGRETRGEKAGSDITVHSGSL